MSEKLSRSIDTADTSTPKHWRFTADQYQRMGEVGIFRKEDRVELLEGEIYEMTPIGSWHGGSTDVLNMTFAGRLAGRAIVRVQGSFRMSPRSEPEPDLLLLRFRPDYYHSALPGPKDVLLLVEVADASLGYDRDVKLPLYARAGIPEFWIVNRSENQIEVYRQPAGDRYRSVTIHERGDTVSPLAFPDISVQVADVLG